MTKNNDMVFGLRPVMEAIKAGKTFDKLFIRKGLTGDLANELLLLAKASKVVLTRVPQEKLDRLTRKNNQGVVGFISPIEFANIDHIIDQCYAQGRDPLVLALDRVTDVRNFGAIVRTAEGAGVDVIIVPARGAAQVSGDAMKTSAGALSLVPIARTNNLPALLNSLQKTGLTLVACTEKTSATIYEVPFSQPTVIIMGAEDTGIDQEILKICDHRARIPMAGKIASLNVATSAGIVLYEAVRQRQVPA